MALIKIHKSLYQNLELMLTLTCSFDTMEFVRYDPEDGEVKIYRVDAAEVDAEEDEVIVPMVFKFDGVDPFVINYNTLK